MGHNTNGKITFSITTIIIIIIITRPWPAFGRQGLVGSSFEYSYTRLASRLRRSARSGIMTLGKDKTPLLLKPSNFTTFRPSWGNDKTNYFNLPTFWPANFPTFRPSNLPTFKLSNLPTFPKSVKEQGKRQNPLNTKSVWKHENDKILCSRVSKNVTDAGHRTTF